MLEFSYQSDKPNLILNSNSVKVEIVVYFELGKIRNENDRQAGTKIGSKLPQSY